MALINQFAGLPLEAFQCGLLTMLVGLISLLPIISTERGRRLFYHGPEPDEDGDPLIGCLWAIAIQVILLAMLGWIVWLIAQLMGIPRK